jgi:hypothetical protein
VQPMKTMAEQLREVTYSDLARECDSAFAEQWEILPKRPLPLVSAFSAQASGGVSGNPKR